MEAVKITLYQNMVNYRQELSFGYVQSYPLPTPSMVRGMAHALLDAKEYLPLKIGIQGTHASVVTNMQRVYKFDRDRKARPDNPYDVEVGTSKKTAKHGVLYVDQLVDVHLTLHISFEDESLHKPLVSALTSNVVVLGRNEDICRIDQCCLIALTPAGDEAIETNQPSYIPLSMCTEQQIIGTAYRLPFCYAPVESFGDKRIFTYVDVKYIDKDEALEGAAVLLDDEEQPVFLLGAEHA